MTTPQQPISSGFRAASTAAEVIEGIDLTGKTAIVTGGYSGLGRETVRVFLKAGARVIVPARDVKRAAAALADIRGAEIEFMDLLDPASIDDFAARFVATGAPLHILVNNAAIMACPLTRDARGYEAQFSTNHLGHFQLVNRLWPALVWAKGARVVSVSSLGHRFSPVVFEDVNFEHRSYDPWQGYGQSKTANILFAVEVDARGKNDGIRAFSVHPGGILETNLAKHMDKQEFIDAGVMQKDGTVILDPEGGLKTVEQGTATQVWCAVHPSLNGIGGVFCEDVEIASIAPEDDRRDLAMGELKKFRGVMSYAIDTGNAARLWKLSEALVENRALV